MPAKNSIKVYVENGIYHIYNRGVEKRTIFESGKDYIHFLFLLKSYLTDPDLLDFDTLPRHLRIKLADSTLYKRIKLLAFCLMPNHFHFIVQQTDARAVEELMRKISNGYVRYFNDKYKRVGTLFQGRYKAVLVTRDEQLMHLSRYIHGNPLEILNNNFEKLEKYSFSSYPYYLGYKKALWLSIKEILSYFEKPRDYQDFIKEYFKREGEIEKDQENIDGLLLDDEV